MKLYKSQGIVFRSTKYGESSLILDIFTREKGLRSFIVSGARKAKSKSSASLFQHLNILDLVAYDKMDTLARIKETKVGFHYLKIPFDITRSSVGLFILEVCKNSIQERESNVELYDYIYNTLTYLDQDDCPITIFPIKFLLDLSQFIGFQPMNNYSTASPYFDLYNGKFIGNLNEKYMANESSSTVIAEILSKPMGELNQLSIPKNIRNQVIDDLIVYYRLHLDQFKELKTLEVLRMIF